jgi:hypothetical protein
VGSAPAIQAPNLPIGDLRAFVTLLVVAHHSVLAYHPFAPATTSLLAEPRWWPAFPVVDAERSGVVALFTGWNGRIPRDSRASPGTGSRSTFVSWLQLSLREAPLGAPAKAAVVFTGAVLLAWGATAAPRRLPAVRRVVQGAATRHREPGAAHLLVGGLVAPGGLAFLYVNRYSYIEFTSRRCRCRRRWWGSTPVRRG